MRKALVVDDDTLCLDILTQYFIDQEFSVTSSSSPTCPLFVQQTGTCPVTTPCYATMLSDYHMEGMTGLEMFEFQAKCGCKVGSERKALISGAIPPAAQKQAEDSGYKVFYKPTPLHQIDDWLNSLPVQPDNCAEED